MHLLRRPRRFVTLAASFGTAAFALVAACSDQTSPTSTPGDDDASGLPRLGDDGGARPVTGDDGGTTGDEDASTTDGAPKNDASTTDATMDAPVDAAPGAACTFNRECPANQRCECDEVKGCFCFVGVRGTGQNGVTECTDGNDCQSSLCVEGNNGKSYCSDECTSAAGCKSKLPVCSNIVGIGKICVRQ